jgi:Plasmid pRiA4b ORF-3-like protein
MGWSGESLHRFYIQGQNYGVNYPGGMFFQQDADEVLLSDFEMIKGERFLYVYDFFANWEHDVFLEEVIAIGHMVVPIDQPAAPTKDIATPSGQDMIKIPRNALRGISVCLAAKQGNPPDGMNGPDAYMEFLTWRNSRETATSLNEAMLVIASRTQAVYEGGEVTALEDTKFMEAADCIEKFLASDTETYSRSEVNRSLRKPAKD